MSDSQPSIAMLRAVAKTCILTFVAVVGFLIILSSVKYFPPQFDFGFLRGREAYFYSWYAVAFYAHVLSAPLALCLGLLQSIAWLRKRYLRLHRLVGYGYVAIVLGLAAPSGLAMSVRASDGIVSVAGFAALAIATIHATWRGFTAARRGAFAEHRQWMTRSYLLICSAVLLRFIAAITSVLGLSFISYAAMAWLCWVPLLVAYEAILRLGIRANARR